MNHNSRKEQCCRLLSKYPSSIPIIVHTRDKSIILPQSKFIVPNHITFSQFMTILRKKINLSKEEALFAFVNHRVVSSAADPLSVVYDIHKDTDGFLTLTLCKENTFGMK